MRTKPPPSQAKERKCIGRLLNGHICGKVFWSKGFHNRICPECNGRNDRLPRGAPRCRAWLGRRPPPQRQTEEMER